MTQPGAQLYVKMFLFLDICLAPNLLLPFFGYLQNEVGKYFYAERKIYSVLCKKWLKNITTHDMLFHAI